MTPDPELPRPWRKSTRSMITNHCVELRPAESGAEIRDSKDARGPILRFDACAWSAFVAAIGAGHFDHP